MPLNQIVEPGSFRKMIRTLRMSEENNGVLILGSLIHSATLPIELTNSNDGRGFSFHRTDKRRNTIEGTLRVLGYQRAPFEFPVNLRITRILGKRQKLWDADSILRGSAKELVDSLVAVHWFHDDGQEWIKNVVGSQEVPEKRDQPMVRVDVFYIGDK